MDRLLLEHSPLIRRAVGGDAWIHIFNDVDSAILWARDVQTEIKRDSVTATIALDWGKPLLIESGALDRASITAIKVAERYGDEENQILLTEEARLHMVDPYLIGLCQSIEPFVSRTLGKVCLHRIKDEIHSFNSDPIDSQRQKPLYSRQSLSPNFQMHMKSDSGSLPTLF
jgi:hypothetical protein